MSESDRFTPQPTADGSFTFFSDEFGEAFHSRYGARQEAYCQFVETTRLPEKAAQPSLCLLDICYGLGYNTAAALDAIWQINPDCRIEWVGLESDPRVPQSAIAHHLLQDWSPQIQHILEQLARQGRFRSDRLNATLHYGDARQTIQLAEGDGIRADAVFLDPFSPKRCPQLWTVDFLARVARCTKPNGYLATYSCAAAVRSALIEVGFAIASTPPFGRNAPGTIASLEAAELPPLPAIEREHLSTRAAIPYRDPSWCDPAEAIVRRRQIEQQQSNAEPTSQWKKRWFSAPQQRDRAED